MKKLLLVPTLISATALAVPAFAFDLSSTGISVSAGATTSIGSGLRYVLTDEAVSVIDGNLIIGEGGGVDINGSFTVNNAIQNAGTITINENTSSFVIGVGLQSTGDYDYYLVIDGSSGAGTVDTGTFDGFTLADGTSLSDWEIYTSSGYLVIYTEASPVPEPSMFGLFFGLGAIGLVATRRRRRA